MEKFRITRIQIAAIAIGYVRLIGARRAVSNFSMPVVNLSGNNQFIQLGYPRGTSSYSVAVNEICANEIPP